MFCFLLLFCYSCPSFSPFALLPPAHPPCSHSQSHTVVHVHGSFRFFDKSLPLLSTITPSPRPSGSCQSVPCFRASGLFCSSVYFVHQIPLISDIIWYLFFINGLISLSIMLSSSIHLFLSLDLCFPSFFPLLLDYLNLSCWNLFFPHK